VNFAKYPIPFKDKEMKTSALFAAVVSLFATNVYAAGEGGFVEAGIGNTTFTGAAAPVRPSQFFTH
jgi:hypothetical protein